MAFQCFLQYFASVYAGKDNAGKMAINNGFTIDARGESCHGFPCTTISLSFRRPYDCYKLRRLVRRDWDFALNKAANSILSKFMLLRFSYTLETEHIILNYMSIFLFEEIVWEKLHSRASERFKYCSNNISSDKGYINLVASIFFRHKRMEFIFLDNT